MIDIRANKYIIELDPQLDINDSDSFGDIEHVGVDGSRETILEHLREGSPCLARKKRSSSSEGMSNNQIIIVGYVDGAILARNSNNQYFEVSESELETLEEFHVLQKYDKSVIEDFERSIQKLIGREPYLNRTDYEHGFQNN